MKKTLGTMVAITVAALLIGTFHAPTYATAAEIGRDGRFIAYDNGTVLDTKTNMMWAAKDNGSDINWTNAKSYCESYRGGGYSDWRLPTVDELESIFDEKAQNAKKGVGLTALINVSNSWMWASDTRESGAGGFDFEGEGERSWGPRTIDWGIGRRALPVRSGK
jgi:hypothetical protein